MITQKKLRIGFDLDGVLLYNPARIIRPITTAIKKLFFKIYKPNFYIPKSKIEKFIWYLLHKSSFFIAPGFSKIINLVRENKIEVYIISARYSFLKDDFELWLDKIKAKKYFSGCFYNSEDEQPHIFKEKMIRKLKLNIYVEDNWDIVQFLKSKVNLTSTKIYWVYNILDKNIEYEFKFSELKKVLDYIENQTYKKKRILMIADYYYPYWTGFTKSIFTLLKNLALFYDITVLTVKHSHNLKKEEYINGVRILRENYLFVLSRSKYSLSIIKTFLKEIGNYDIVFINCPCSNIIFFTIIAKIFRKKILVYHHAHLLLPKSLLNRTIEKIFEFSSFISYLLVDKISTPNWDYARHSLILSHFINKIDPILMPISVSDNVSHNNITSLKTFDFKNKIIFGFAGRFVYEKGFDILFDAIPKVVDKIPQAVFIYAGESNIFYENFYLKNEERIKKVSKSFINLGFLKDKQLERFYKSLDFIVVPSRIDSFNLVQAEACYLGIPSIVSDVPGVRFLVKKTGFGLIFKKNDSVNLALRIIEGVKKREEIIKNYPKVLKILDNNRNIEKFRKFIES